MPTARATRSRTRSSAPRPRSRHLPLTMRSLWPRGGLWRHRDFLRLWTGETISQFGSQISQLAIPLTAILVLDATAFEVAAQPTVPFLPFIIFTLPAGVWVDRMRRRPILIAGDVVRALLLGSI